MFRSEGTPPAPAALGAGRDGIRMVSGGGGARDSELRPRSRARRDQGFALRRVGCGRREPRVAVACGLVPPPLSPLLPALQVPDPLSRYLARPGGEV